jgi:glycosyltransferase involved in cell wall biosynthesis
MKILHIIINLAPGGAQKLVEEIVPIMDKAEGVEAEVLLLSEDYKVFDKQLVENNINIKVSPFKKLRSPLQAFYISKIIKNGEYDVVHTHLFPTNYWTALSSMFLFKNKAKIITTEHNTHNKRRDKKIVKYLDKIIYSRFDKVISISEETQKNLVSWIQPAEKNNNKFKVINNGINSEKFSSAAPYRKSDINSDFSEDTKLLCMVGRFSKQKDQETIIKAMKELPEDIHLLLIGDGDLKKDHENLARKLEVEDRVHFLGFRDDVERIVKTSDIVIVSSHWEGFGLVAAEGMAAGKPVLASDVPGLAAVVGEPELLFEVNNSGQLSEKVHTLTTDKNKYKLFAGRCSQRAKVFDIHTMAELYLNEYKTNEDTTMNQTEAEVINYFREAVPLSSPNREITTEKVRDNVYIVKTETKKYLVKLVREEEKKTLGKIQKLLQTSSFRNEIEVNKALLEKSFDHLKFPRLINSGNKGFVVFEYIEPLENASFKEDNFVPSLVEFQLTDLNLNLNWKDNLLLKFRNKVSWNILRWSFDVVLPRGGMKEALQCFSLFRKLNREHKAFSKPVNLHNDFGGNTIVSKSSELYIIDFESVVKEKKWILVDVLQRVFDEENFTVNREDLNSYLSMLCKKLSITTEGVNLKVQLRILLMRRMMQILRSGSRDENKKAATHRFLIDSVLSDEGYDLWYSQNVDVETESYQEEKSRVL